MPEIPVTDKFGLVIDLNFDDHSAVARLGLHSLESKTSEFVTAARQTLDQTTFRSAVFGGTFTSSPIGIGSGGSLTLSTGATASVSIYRTSEANLFDTAGASPIIAISPNQAWVSFSLQTSSSVEPGVIAPSGFGVSGKAVSVNRIASYALVTRDRITGAFPTVGAATEHALSSLRLLQTAADIRSQPENTVCEWDVSGTFSIEGGYQYPLAANPLSLASVPLLFGSRLEIGPELALEFLASAGVTGEFEGRCYRTSGGKAQLGLYKKKGSDLSVTFGAQAGVSAGIGSVDLLGPLFKLLGIPDLERAGLSSPDRDAMNASLAAALETGLSVALNTVCSASETDEAAVLYEIDLATNSPDLDQALNAALLGNWSQLARTPGARELRNILTSSHETRRQTALNLLGIYNYASVDDFVRQAIVLHDNVTGAITVTDKETAARLTVASAPFATNDEKLRRVLDESFLATVTYAASNAPSSASEPVMEARQQLFLYQSRASPKDIRKNLLLGQALGLLTTADIEQPSAPRQQQHQYFRLAASAAYNTAAALHLFFSDVAAQTPRSEAELQQLGRRVLASLLDENDPVDNKRQEVLRSDTLWAAMETQRHFPPNSPASYSDWYDITFWAHALASVAPLLKSVLAIANTLHGTDPSKNAAFMRARNSIAKALAEVTHETHAAFEKGWPLAVLFAVSERAAFVTFEAQWDGKLQFERQSPRAMTA